MISKIRNVVEMLFLSPFWIAVFVSILIDIFNRKPKIIDSKEYAKEVLEFLPIGLEWMASSLFWILILTIILN